MKEAQGLHHRTTSKETVTFQCVQGETQEEGLRRHALQILAVPLLFPVSPLPSVDPSSQG